MAPRRKKVDPDAPRPEPKTTGVGPSKPDGGRPANGSAAQEHIEERRQRVETLELQGATMRQMAELLRVDYRTIWDDVQAIRKQRRERYVDLGQDVTQERDLELARLERQRVQIEKTLGIQPDDQQGRKPPTYTQQAQLHRTLLGIAKRKADLLGLDAPVKFRIGGEGAGAEETDGEGMDELPRPTTLGDLLAGANGAEVAKVIHMATKRTG